MSNKSYSYIFFVYFCYLNKGSTDKGSGVQIMCPLGNADQSACQGTCTAKKFCKLPWNGLDCDYKGHVDWNCERDEDCAATCAKNHFGEYECKIPMSVDTLPASKIGAHPDGGEYIYIDGSNFGPLSSMWNEVFLDKVTYGPEANPGYYRAKDCKVLKASKQIRCKTAPGIGSKLFWVAIIKEQASPVHTDTSPTTYYALPNIISIETEGTSNIYDTVHEETKYIDGSVFQGSVQCSKYTQLCGCRCIGLGEECTVVYWKNSKQGNKDNLFLGEGVSPYPDTTEAFNCLPPHELVAHGPTSGTYYNDDSNLADYFITIKGKHFGYKLAKPPLMQADIRILFDKSAYLVSKSYNDLLTRDPQAPSNDPIDVIHRFKLPVGYGMHDKTLQVETSTANPNSGGPPELSNIIRFVYNPPVIDNIHVAPWGTTSDDVDFYRLTLEGFNFGAGDCNCRTFHVTPAPSKNYPKPESFQCTNQRPTDETECKFIQPAAFLGSGRVNDTSHYKQVIQFKIYRDGEYIAPTAGNVTLCVGDRCVTRGFSNKSPAIQAEFLNQVAPMRYNDAPINFVGTPQDSIAAWFNGNPESNKCYQNARVGPATSGTGDDLIHLPNLSPWNCGPYPTKGLRMGLALPGLELGIDLRRIRVLVEKVDGAVLGGITCDADGAGPYFRGTKECVRGNGDSDADFKKCQADRKLPPSAPKELAGVIDESDVSRVWCDADPKSLRQPTLGTWLVEKAVEGREPSSANTDRSLPHLLNTGYLVRGTCSAAGLCEKNLAQECRFDSECDSMFNMIFVSIPPGQGLNKNLLIERDSKRSERNSKVKIDYLPPVITYTLNSKEVYANRVVDMQGNTLCTSVQNGYLPDSSDSSDCRKVPTKGLDVQIFGENLGLYGEILFHDGRINQCTNVTFGCCNGDMDHDTTSDSSYLSTKAECLSQERDPFLKSYLWVNTQGHECKENVDTNCHCRARQSCSIGSAYNDNTRSFEDDVLVSNSDSCSNLGGAKYTRSCLCSLNKGYAVDGKNKMCERCPITTTTTNGEKEEGYVTLDGRCVQNDLERTAGINLEKVARIWDHDSIVFQLPSGLGIGHHIEISVTSQTTLSNLFDYEPPTIYSVLPKKGPTGGTASDPNFILTLNGKNFGNHDAEVHMGIGETECEGNNHVQGPDVCLYRLTIISQDHETIKVKLPAGIGNKLPIRVRVGGQVSNMDITFDYQVPVIHQVYPLHGRTDGFDKQPTDSKDEYGRQVFPDSQLITFIGEHFGTVHDRTRVLRIGKHLFEGIPSSSNNTMLQFILPQGTGLNHTVSIEVGKQKSVNHLDSEFEFDYDEPIIYPINYITWTPQTGNINFPSQNGKYYAPTTGCANPASQMATTVDPENPPTKRKCITSARIILHGENFGCCVHTEEEIIRNNGAFPEDCAGGHGSLCTETEGPRVVMTDENGLVKYLKINSYGHYKIEADLPEGTGKSTISIEVGPDYSSSKVFKTHDSVTYEEKGFIGFSYSKPQLTETKFGLEISGADITNSFDATGSSKYGTLDGEKDTQWQLFIFGDNFGASQSPTQIEVLAGYFNDGSEDWKNCTEPIWHEPSGHSAGFPYLSCFPPAVTVGNKRWKITIGSNSQIIDYTIYGRPIMGKCPPEFYGLTDEYCVRCWHYNTDAAPDSPISLANCSGIYDAQIQVWKRGKLVTVGGTSEPIARFGYSIWPPKECSSGQCDKRSYKGLLPQESGISLVPDDFTKRTGSEKSASCLPTWDAITKKWTLPSMICAPASKPGDMCHPLRAFGHFSVRPDPMFEHKDRNLHAWPPHKVGAGDKPGKPPLTRGDCVEKGGTWASHVIYDRSSRTSGDARKTPLADACIASPYNNPKSDLLKPECRKAGGSYTKIDPSPGCRGDECFECRLPCCLSIYEDGMPKYKERTVDAFPGGGNDMVSNVVEPEEDGELYEFLGKRPVCSRANPCTPKYACLGGDVCLEGYVKYYEPYVQKDGEYVCSNFHYKLPGSCPSPIVTWGPIRGFSSFDKDFLKQDVPHQHAYLISVADGSSNTDTIRRFLSNSTISSKIEGTFDFQTDFATDPNYRTKWCEDDETDYLCFWGTPVKVLGYANDAYETPTVIDSEAWKVLSKSKIKKMKFDLNSTKNSLLETSRVIKKLSSETGGMTKVKIQMYDKSISIVPTKDLILIRYPSLRVSGVPESIDPDGGNAAWCIEHPARCYWERNPHPKGKEDDQGALRPQANMCCFAPKCSECDPSTHFRMEENCVACPKCWWCIPVMAVCALFFGSIAGYYLVKMRLNFVIISLAFDHMQILGLLAACKIDWPLEIKFFFHIFSFMQLDIDVAGPECLARGLVTFENKWWFKVLLPFVVMFVVLIVILLGLCCANCGGGKKRNKQKSVAELVKKGKHISQKMKKKKSGLLEDLSHNGQTTKAITYLVKAFINVVALCCK